MGEDALGLCGTVVDGRYRVDAVVGEGGFGIVYRGYHLGFEHPIAIKVLKLPDHFVPEARSRFLTKFREEGKVLSRLASTHLSIVRVFDSGVIDRGGEQTPYLVLEWLEGQDLEQIIAERASAGDTYGEAEALTLLRPAVEAIAAAHETGIAHRDIKPANLFVVGGPSGTIKVLDFGIAKAMAEGETATQQATRTSSGFRAFTPLHGAPEQFHSSKFGPSGPWSDVHALGLVLSEMLTGRPAYGGEEPAELVRAAMLEQRPTPRSLGASVSDAFEDLCRKALALRPTDRFADAGALLAAMDALQSTAVPLSPAVGPTAVDDLAFAETALPRATSTVSATIPDTPVEPPPPPVAPAATLPDFAEQPPWHAAPPQWQVAEAGAEQRRFGGGAILAVVSAAIVLCAAAIYLGVVRDASESEPDVIEFSGGKPAARGGPEIELTVVEPGDKGNVPPTGRPECDACGKGRASNALTEAVKQRVPRIGQRCYNPAMGGAELRIRLRLGSDGSVCGVIMHEEARAPRELTTCIAKGLYREKFSPPPGGCVVYNVPLRFEAI